MSDPMESTVTFVLCPFCGESPYLMPRFIDGECVLAIHCNCGIRRLFPIRYENKKTPSDELGAKTTNQELSPVGGLAFQPNKEIE